MLSYAQLFEDVYLQRCFAHQSTGFYIDVGACHPVHCNSSYHFYQRGWIGINVEPTPHRLAELTRARPRDVCIGAALGRADGTANFNVSANADHLSSLYPQSAAMLDSHRAVVDKVVVEVVSLASLCARHSVGQIDFLKIDVEGAEADVIAGADWRRWRPAVIVIEATVPGTSTPAWGEWEPDLLAAGYTFAFFDGVNRFYIASERAELRTHFETPCNPFDGALALHSLGSAIDDRRHPDHAWARRFVERLLAGAAVETDNHLLTVMTWDLMKSELTSPATREGVELAFQRVLARPAEADHLQFWVGKPGSRLEQLYRDLLSSAEFRTRRSRVSTSSMWR